MSYFDLIYKVPTGNFKSLILLRVIKNEDFLRLAFVYTVALRDKK